MFVAYYPVCTGVQDVTASVTRIKILRILQVLRDARSSFTHEHPGDDNC